MAPGRSGVGRPDPDPRLATEQPGDVCRTRHWGAESCYRADRRASLADRTEHRTGGSAPPLPRPLQEPAPRRQPRRLLPPRRRPGPRERPARPGTPLPLRGPPALRPASALRWRARPPRLPDEALARRLALPRAHPRRVLARLATLVPPPGSTAFATTASSRPTPRPGRGWCRSRSSRHLQPRRPRPTPPPRPSRRLACGKRSATGRRVPTASRGLTSSGRSSPWPSSPAPAAAGSRSSPSSPRPRWRSASSSGLSVAVGASDPGGARLRRPHRREASCPPFLVGVGSRRDETIILRRAFA